MLGKIETQSRSLLSPSTTCDLLTVKMNHDAPCYLSEDLVTDKLLQEAKSAEVFKKVQWTVQPSNWIFGTNSYNNSIMSCSLFLMVT